MYIRLSVLSFLIYSVPGSWFPLFSRWLEEELRFTPWQTAFAFSSWAIGAMTASLIAGQVADRWLSLERCLSACGFVVGASLLILSNMTSPWAVCSLSVTACLFMVPTFTLGVTYCLTHLDQPERQFSHVRLWGTIGWVTPALLLFLWFSRPVFLQPLFDLVAWEKGSLSVSPRLAGVLAFCLGLYALTLPHAPPIRISQNWLAPLAAIHLLRRRPFAVFCASAFLINVTMAFNVQQTQLLLGHLGIANRWIPLVQTTAQTSEVVILWLLPVISLRLGTRNTLLTGLVAWTAAMFILTIGRPAPLVIGSLLLNGFLICCFWIRGQVFIARTAGPDIRASAQGLVTMLNGCGLLVGNVLVGWVRGATGRDFVISYGVATCVALMSAVVFFVGFREKVTQEEPAVIEFDPAARDVKPVPASVEA